MSKLALLAAVVCLISYCWAQAQEPTGSKTVQACGYAGPPPASNTTGASHGVVVNASCADSSSATANTLTVDDVFNDAASVDEGGVSASILSHPSLRDCMFVPWETVYCIMAAFRQAPPATLAQAYRKNVPPSPPMQIMPAVWINDGPGKAGLPLVFNYVPVSASTGPSRP